MKQIIISIFLIFPIITFAQNVPIEPCSFESNDLWIKLVTLCPEGDIACDKDLKETVTFYIMNSLMMIQNI